jgi:hypothetical protein
MTLLAGDPVAATPASIGAAVAAAIFRSDRRFIDWLI